MTLSGKELYLKTCCWSLSECTNLSAVKYNWLHESRYAANIMYCTRVLGELKSSTNNSSRKKAKKTPGSKNNQKLCINTGIVIWQDYEISWKCMPQAWLIFLTSIIHNLKDGWQGTMIDSKLVVECKQHMICRCDHYEILCGHACPKSLLDGFFITIHVTIVKI